MSDTTSKEKILKKIRKALITASANVEDYSKVDFESEIYPAPTDDLELIFGQQFSKLNGKFVFCVSEDDFLENFREIISENEWINIFALEPSLQALLNKGSIAFSSAESDLIKTDIGVTTCECLIARTGSVMISSRQASGRRLPVFSNIHVVVAYTSQLVYNIKDGLKLIKSRYGDQIPSLISNITGPSRTADIEKTLVQGAHGPKEIFVFLIDDSTQKQ